MLVTPYTRPARPFVGFTANAALYGMSPGATSAVNTAALQAAIDAVAPLKGRVLIPSALAAYTIGAITIGTSGTSDCCAIEGESWNGKLGAITDGGVVLQLDDEVNTSMFTIADTAGPCVFRSLALWGNRDNQTSITQGGGDVSYAIDLTNYTTDSTVQRAIHTENVHIAQFASGGIRAGTLRNAGYLGPKTTILDCGRKEAGTATAGGASTITLAAGANAADDFYNGMPIVIAAGTGVGQKRTISDYVGATKVATVDVAWAIQPDATSQYKIGLTLADGVVFGSNNDWRCAGVDTGSHTRNGFYLTGGGSVGFRLECNSFSNWNCGLQADDTAQDMTWEGGSIDRNYSEGVLSKGSVSAKYSRIFETVRFSANGLGAHDTYADVKCHNDDNVSVIDCVFLKGSAALTNSRYPKYSIEASGTTATIWVSNYRYDTANAPWTTARFSSEPVIRGLTESGSYQPSLTGVNNIAASTTQTCYWSRNGNHVIVSGRILVDPTLAAPTDTQIGLSLPIASNIAAAGDVAGAAASAAASGTQAGAITGDAANNRAELRYRAVDAGNNAMYFTFGYPILA